MKARIIAMIIGILSVSVLAGCAQMGNNTGSSPSAVIANSSASANFSPSASATSPETSAPLTSPSPSSNLEPASYGDTTQFIYDKYKGDKTNNADIKSILSALSGLNWTEFDKLTGGRAVEFIQWLYKQDFSNQDSLILLLNSTKNLDGAFTDGYAGLITSLLRSNPKTFIESLAQLDESKAEIIYPLIAYGTGNGTHAGSSISDVQKLLAGNELSEKEKNVAHSLLKAMPAK